MPDVPDIGPAVLVVYLLAVAAAYRITRFWVDDSLMGWNPRSESEAGAALDRWARTPDGDDRTWFRGRVGDLLVCTYCSGFWFSLAVTCLWFAAWPWQLGRYGWLTAIAVAGGQALLNALDHRINS